MHRKVERVLFLPPDAAPSYVRQRTRALQWLTPETPYGRGRGMDNSHQQLMEDAMGGIRLIAVVLIVAGVLGLVYGGFSYTKENTAAKLGPIELKVEETKQVNIPLWAGIAAIAVGGVVLLGASRK